MCYLKQETYSDPISFEVLVQQHWELELVTESQLGEVQMKPPNVESCQGHLRGLEYPSSLILKAPF